MVDVRERLSAIESLLRTYPEIFATKADLHHEMQALTLALYQALAEQAKRSDAQFHSMKDELNKQTWRLLTYVTSFGIVLTSALYFIVSQVK